MELLSQILGLNMQQNYHKTTVLCNGNHFSFSISSSSADRPVVCASSTGALVESDHWFIQQELKSDNFNFPVLKLGKKPEMPRKWDTQQLVGERERWKIHNFQSLTARYAETDWAPSFGLEVMPLPVFPVRLKHGLWWWFACGWMKCLLSVIVFLSWFSLAERENSFWGDILPL